MTSVIKIVGLLLSVLLLQACLSETSSGEIPEVGQIAARWDQDLERYRQQWPKHFGIGRSPSDQQIEQWDIDVRPDGRGLPASGAGLARRGALLYAQKCASCHGQQGYEGPYDKLVTDSTGSNTIGNYWPFATTIFDYVRRAMPFNAPGSLTDQQVYDITAYLLFANGIIEQDQVIDHRSLPQVKMPAKDRFVVDDRQGGKEIR